MMRFTMKAPSHPPPRNDIVVNVPPKLALIVVVVLLGSGGSLVGFTKALNGSGADESSHISDLKDREAKLNKLEKAVETNTDSIESLELQLTAIQKVQHNDIARSEARRVTRDITNQKKRQVLEDRIYQVNMTRLQKGDPPCLDLTCSN
jgi:hypothetical protein